MSTERLSILVVDDEPGLREVLSLRLTGWGYDVELAGDLREAEQAIAGRRPDLVLSDVVLPGASGVDLLRLLQRNDPGLPVILMTAHGAIDVAVEAMKEGARDFLTKPLDQVALRILLDSTATDIRRRAELADTDAVGEADAGLGRLVGQSRVMRELQTAITQLATSDASVIITGESGTGKEVVARAIHDLSARRKGPFVAVNAAAIPDGLVESEIFGHEAGAFTGAKGARPGCFEQADGGTLFLDEIAEMPIGLQPKLLRILESGSARRLGGSREIPFDVRILAATNRVPALAIKEGGLREDLFYRLNVFELELVPLRERRGDVPLLSERFRRQFSAKHGMEVIGLRDETFALLEGHPWPGNVRELRNVMERAVIVARSGWIEPIHLPPYLRAGKGGGPATITLPIGATMAEAERRMILETLERVGQNKAEAARRLGMDEKTIRNKLKAYARDHERGMKVSTKLSGAFALLIAILAALLVYHVRTIRAVVTTGQELAEVSSRLYLGATEQRERIDRLDENATKFGVTHDAGYLEKFRITVAAFDTAQVQLGALGLDPQERAELQRLDQAWAGVRPLAERLRLLARAGAPRPVRDSFGLLKARLAGLHELAIDLSAASRNLMLLRLDRASAIAAAAERLSWGAAGLALLVSVVVAGVIVRSITESLGRWKAGIHEVALGNFEYRLEAMQEDEFAAVARDFNLMTRRLGELDQVKRDFLSRVSHDLKSPLASIQETTGLLLEEVPGGLSASQRRLLELSHQSGDRLSGMIAKLLDAARLESGAAALRLATVDARGIVREACEGAGPAGQERGLSITVSGDPHGPLVECDAEAIREVLDNLIENAVKFSPPGGTIAVGARGGRGSDGLATVEFFVEDGGPGVPVEEKERVFERFFQTESGRSVRGRGVGLGLAICRDLVGAHAGRIWVDDRPEGGSVFRVLLPGTQWREDAT